MEEGGETNISFHQAREDEEQQYVSLSQLMPAVAQPGLVLHGALQFDVKDEKGMGILFDAVQVSREGSRRI